MPCEAEDALVMDLQRSWPIEPAEFCRMTPVYLACRNCLPTLLHGGGTVTPVRRSKEKILCRDSAHAHHTRNKIASLIGPESGRSYAARGLQTIWSWDKGSSEGVNQPLQRPSSLQQKTRRPTNPSSLLRARRPHRRRAAVCKVSEVLLEQGGQVPCRLLELLRRLPVLLPRVLRPKHLPGNILDAGLEHHETEDWHLLPLRIRKGLQRPVMDGIDELPRVLQAAAAASAIGAPDPARVHQVGARSILVQLCRQHLRVDKWVPHQEGSPEASREGGLWLLHALLSAGNLRCVPGDEVVHHLVLGQLRDRWQHTKGITSQQDDLFWMVLHLGWDPGVGDVLERIGHARVLRDRNIPC